MCVHSEVLYIEFKKVNSKNYDKACRIIKNLPNYKQEGIVTTCYIENIEEYLLLQHVVFSLIECICSWKNSKIYFMGHEYRGNKNPINVQSFIKKHSGEYSCLISDRYPVDVACGLNTVAYEALPLPIVYYPSAYGAFFAFSEKLDGQIYFCECQRKAIDNYIKLRKKNPLSNYSGSKTYPLGTDFFPEKVAELSRGYIDNPLESFGFKEKICFRCNNKIPNKRYCDPMYGGKFMQRYGWYVKEEYFNLGIDLLQLSNLNILLDECTPEIYDSLKRIVQLENKYEQGIADNYDELLKLRKIFYDSIENSVRERLGYPRIGECWVSETILFHIIENIYCGETIIRHHRPKWLEGLELDIFLPEKKLAFEYQGIQHFKPVKHWGGEEQLKKQKEHDMRKKEICKREGIKLICINYDEELTTEAVLRHIKNVLG